MRITLENGIILDDSELACPTLSKYAKAKHFDDVRVFVATHPDGEQSYLLVQGQTPVFESQQFEAIAVRIDMMAADRDMP